MNLSNQIMIANSFIYSSFYFQIVLFFGHVVLSFLLAFVISLSFEAPVVTMLKILTPNRKKILVENRD